MKYTVIEGDPVTIRALLAGAAELHRVIDIRNVALGVIEDGSLGDDEPRVAVVMAARDAGAADRAYTVATVEAKPRLIRVQPEHLVEGRPQHEGDTDHHSNSDGGMTCVCTKPCCNSDGGALCTCPPCTSDFHRHAESR